VPAGQLRRTDDRAAGDGPQIIIAGAGAIGMEFAYVLKNYGVEVTIVDFLPRALPNEDAESSRRSRSSTRSWA
jgi:pyruvate/2-oxoglutarate dehydrogenase complex dihydrolipoamide dehydrogenase (E3) component